MPKSNDHSLIYLLTPLIASLSLYSAAVFPAAADQTPEEQAQSQPGETRPPLRIEIDAPLIQTRWQQAPSGVTLIDASDIGNGRSRLQPTDSLNLAPGVLVQNRNNFAQNPRVSIRGFGARAPFGIRGVRVRLDGIPLTTVDGQAQIDAIDPSTIKSIEVLRGANAVLHGNGSGGLLDYHSVSSRDAPLIKADAQLGGFGLRRAHAAFSNQHDAHSDTEVAYLGSITQLAQTGYRDQSEVERRNASLRFDAGEGDRDWFAILHHLDNPLAQDPGALSYDEWQQDDTQAAPLASRMDAAQDVDQNIASIGMTQRFDHDGHSLRAQTWLLGRDFQQQLPFPGDSLIRYDRTIIGGNIQYQRPIKSDALGELTLHTQLSMEDQQDDRQRYCRDVDLQPFMCRNGITTDLALDQLESANNTGVGVQLAGPVAAEQGRWIVGIRHDRLRLSIEDRLQAGGIDSSGDKNYDETNYSLGYSHKLGESWTAFSQYATSFEAPTFTEFANPSGSGFRPGLEPQTSESFEVGIRGQRYNFRIEASMFTVRVKDEIVVDDSPLTSADDERTFYRNAERTRRDGLELGGRWWPDAIPTLQLSAAATYMDARFDSPDSQQINDTGNNTLPGLPAITAFLDAEQRYTRGYFKGYFIGLSAQYIGERFADDANTIEVDAQTVTDLRLGRTLAGQQYDARFVLGIENLFDTGHLDNLRINARNGRYYEPGAERRVYAGLELSWR